VTTGYSGTPLAKKLSLKPGMRVWRHGMPDAVAAEIGDNGLALELLERPADALECAHIFVTERGELERLLTTLKSMLAPGGFVWVSWPKKASKVPTDVTEDVIRHVCLPMGLVDVKVCAIDAVWSGLKLMVRRPK
jgi:hypothetical protein